jgi:hypothetical protein
MCKEVFKVFCDSPNVWSDKSFKVALFVCMISSEKEEKMKLGSFFEAIINSEDINDIVAIQETWNQLRNEKTLEAFKY